MPTTNEVYVAIESELAYQDHQSADASRPDMIPELSPGDTILAMEHCLEAARRAWYGGSAPHGQAAEHIRKVTALGVRFMKSNTAPLRNSATPKS